jgi:YegS/Rv2252/BmrU family lipid kinase
MKIVLIANPAARRASERKISEAASLLRERGHDVKLLLTEKRGDAEIFSKQAALALERPDLVLAAGGDGTFNEAVNGLAGSEAGGLAGSEVPMAMLPLGTTNVLAKEAGIPEDVRGAVETALSGRTHSVSLGKITFSQGQGTSRYFLLMAGIGFDAESVRGVGRHAKRISGAGAHIISGLRALIKWNPERLSIDMDGKPLSGYSLIVCNAARYAGPYMAAPDARIEEPALYVFLMHGRRRIDILRYVLGILTGRHLKLNDVSYLRAERVDVKGRAAVQLDGDFIGATPASITVVPNALKLVY